MDIINRSILVESLAAQLDIINAKYSEAVERNRELELISEQHRELVGMLYKKISEMESQLRMQLDQEDIDEAHKLGLAVMREDEREKTLKEVGEWLQKFVDSYCFGHTVVIFQKHIAKLLEGEMPE